MTSKLKCPVCGGELEEALPIVKVLGCPKCRLFGCIELYERFEQSQKDLENARKALEEIRDETGEDRAGFSYVVLAINMKETAEKALKLIEYKDENNG